LKLSVVSHNSPVDYLAVVVVAAAVAHSYHFVLIGCFPVVVVAAAAAVLVVDYSGYYTQKPFLVRVLS